MTSAFLQLFFKNVLSELCHIHRDDHFRLGDNASLDANWGRVHQSAQKNIRTAERFACFLENSIAKAPKYYIYIIYKKYK